MYDVQYVTIAYASSINWILIFANQMCEIILLKAFGRIYLGFVPKKIGSFSIQL
jgi:hypothetical protein